MTKQFDPANLKKLYHPPTDSHKGQNGKLMVIGGSRLFHGASLWALKVASRIVDMVFYSSVEENIKVADRLKSELFDFIAVPRNNIDDYMEEADVVLIGPGLPREEGREEGEEKTREFTERLLTKYPKKRWVIDGGSLQTMDISFIPKNAILTPHRREFEILFKLKTQNSKLKTTAQKSKVDEETVLKMAKEYNCTILLKGQTDIVCSVNQCVEIRGGNPGMTKGGTGDVLAGLVASLYCKNDAFLSACAGSYINKKAGDSLYQRVGLYFNASDLADEIPRVMKKNIL